MTAKNRILDFLFYFIIGTLYSYALARAVLAATLLRLSPSTLFWLCALFVLIFYGVFFNKYTFFPVLGGLILFGLVLYLVLRRQQFEAEWYINLKDHIGQLILYFMDRSQYRKAYNFTFGLAISFVFSLLAAVNIRIHFNFYILTLLGLGVFAVPVYMDWGLSESAMLLFIFCSLVFLSKKLNLFTVTKEKGAKKANPGAALFAVPVCLAVVLIAWLVPKPELDTNNQYVRQYFMDATDNIVYEMGGKKIISFTQNGERLGGAISLDNQPVMDVYTDERVYLSGMIRDVYTGAAWRMSEGNRKEPVYEDGLYMTYDYPNSIMDSLLYHMRYYGWTTNTITIDTRDNRTWTVFSPPFRISLDLPGDYALTKDHLSGLSVSRALDRNTSYTQEYIAWNYDSEYFAYLLRNAPPNDWADSGEMEQYLALPSSVPQRVQTLAHELTDGLGNDYDKIKALERYLAQFTYTLTPEAIPDGADFVDHFLFTGQEGYCTYYASALAVMGRSIGIPTRYVEGFALPEEQNENGGYTVTNAQAHAWAEAYFPEFGWVLFEATPPNFNVLYDEELPSVVLDSEELPDPMEEVDNTPEEPDTQSPESPAGAGGGNLLIWLLAFAALGGVVLFVLLKCMVAVVRKRFKRIDTMPNREASVMYFSHLLKAADAYGYPISDQETAHDYADRVGGSFAFEEQAVTMEDLANIFSEASYSKREISDADRRTMKQCYYEMLCKVRKTGISRLKYYLDRYILMKF